jgi:hypothetical protein
LQRHIHAAGLSRRLKWAADLLERADAFSESIHLYFSEGRHSDDLPAENKQKALDVIAALETVGVTLITPSCFPTFFAEKWERS